MNDFDIKNNVLMGYHGADTVVTIPAGVVGIHWFCSDPMASVCKIIMPEGVQYIRKGAFMNASIEDIEIPDTLHTINCFAFAGSKLHSVQIPAGMCTLEEGVFRNCRELQYVVLKEGLKTIDKEAFVGCRKLKSINLPSSVERIAENAFRHCYCLTAITIQGTLTVIEKNAFEPLRNCIIHAPLDSAAIQFARENGFRYRCLEISSGRSGDTK